MTPNMSNKINGLKRIYDILTETLTREEAIALLELHAYGVSYIFYQMPPEKREMAIQTFCDTVRTAIARTDEKFGDPDHEKT